MVDTDRGKGKPALCRYPVEGGPPVEVAFPWGRSEDIARLGLAAVTSQDERYVFAIVWPNPSSVLSNADIPCLHADPTWPPCPPGRRVYRRGKIYLLEGTLEDLVRRVRTEIAHL